MTTSLSGALDPELQAALAGQPLAIVGGTGLVGHNLARVAQAHGAAVYCVSRSLPPPERRQPDVDYVAASVLDGDAMAALPPASLAVYVAGATSNYLDDPLGTVRLGTEGLQRFLSRFSGAAHRLLVGSTRIYGLRPDERPLVESDACLLPSPSLRNIYDGMKLVSEALALAASSAAHPVSCARLANVIAPGGLRSTATLFSSLVRQALHERRLRVESPRALRNFVGGTAAAHGLLRALLFGRGGESYNIGGTDRRLEALARTIAAALPFAITIEAKADAEPLHLAVSGAKAAAELGYRPPANDDERELAAAVKWELEHSS